MSKAVDEVDAAMNRFWDTRRVTPLNKLKSTQSGSLLSAAEVLHTAIGARMDFSG